MMLRFRFLASIKAPGAVDPPTEERILPQMGAGYALSKDY